VLVATVAAATLAVAWEYFAVGEVRTPALVGLPLGEAERLVAGAGLRLRSYPVEARGYDAEVVIEQSPPAGAIVRGGRTLNVGVHVPAEADRMPVLVGLTESDAIATLRGLGLPSPHIDYVSSSEPTGRVVTQEPDAGRSVAPGSAVRFVVSRGAETPYVELPDLRGLAIEAARSQALALGIRRVEAVPVAIGVQGSAGVSVQRPGPGSVVNVGQPLTLGYPVEGSRLAQVPDVAGLAPWRARVALRSAGLAIGPTETVHRSDLPLGVVETRPSGLTAAGAPVTLVVNAEEGQLAGDAIIGGADGSVPGDGSADGSLPAGGDAAGIGTVVGGDPRQGRLVPFRFDPRQLGVTSLIERDYDLRLVLRDDGGERTVLERRVVAGESVRTTVVVQGDEPLLQTYVNGVFFQAWRP